MGNNHGFWYYGSVTISIFSIVCYQIFQKSINPNINPVVSVIISYAIALVCSFLLLLISPFQGSFFEEIRKANIASYLVGIAIVGIEMGYLLAYRSGFKLSLAMPVTSSVSIVILAIVGYFIYKEHLNPLKIFGIVLCVAGIFILNLKK